MTENLGMSKGPPPPQELNVEDPEAEARILMPPPPTPPPNMTPATRRSLRRSKVYHPSPPGVTIQQAPPSNSPPAVASTSSSSAPSSSETLKRRRNSDGLEGTSKRRKLGNLFSEPEAESDPTVYTLLRKSGYVSDWDDFLMDKSAVEWVCPVDYFPHAPFSKNWNDFARIGAKIELKHPQAIGTDRVNCIATVIHFAGYKALVRFEKLNSLDNPAAPNIMTWMSFCSSLPKPLGYSLRKKMLLLPVEGAALIKPDVNWKELVEKFIRQEFEVPYLASIPTVAKDHKRIVREELQKLYKGRCRLNQIVEVVDYEVPTRCRLAHVHSITGDRMYLKYLEPGKTPRRKEAGIAFNVKSELVHPFGFSRAVGLEVKSFMKDVQFPNLHKSVFPDLPKELNIAENMTFEMRHPVYPEKIVSAYVTKKLKMGYFIARISTNTESQNLELALNVRSDYVLPCGFCERNRIGMEVPEGEYDCEFTWGEYCTKKLVMPLDLSVLPEKPTHKFKKGHKFEAVDARDTSYLGPATVINVAEHLLLIHFDGWPKGKPGSSQWVSAFSPDIYPVGYAELVGHVFQSTPEAPKVEDQFSIVRIKEEPDD